VLVTLAMLVFTVLFTFGTIIHRAIGISVTLNIACVLPTGDKELVCVRFISIHLQRVNRHLHQIAFLCKFCMRCTLASQVITSIFVSETEILEKKNCIN
jgi:hypothetical protein